MSNLSGQSSPAEATRPLPNSQFRRTLRTWLARLGLVLFGLGLAFVMLQIVLRLVPEFQFGGRTRLLDLGMVKFTAGMGDLYVVRPGAIKAPPDPNLVLSEHRLVWDEDGFRFPAKVYNQYDVWAIGDSYTEAANTARPWPDALAAEGNLSVRNMGFRGYGPVEELKLLKEYIPRSKPKLVIIGFFEGNDIDEIISARWQQSPFVLPKLLGSKLVPFDANVKGWQTAGNGPWQFPVRLNVNGTLHEMAFLDNYLSNVSGLYDDFAKSDNAKSIEDLWKESKGLMGSGTCLMIAYFPSGPHIYAPYVIPEDRPQLMQTISRRAIEKPGEALAYASEKPTFEQTIEMTQNPPRVFADIARRQGIPFLDLTPAFQQAAARGELLYYDYDTHWNQSGHDLAGKTIAQYLKQNPNPCEAK